MIGRSYRCEICGAESDNPTRWIVIRCNTSQLTIYKWTKEEADAPGHGTIAASPCPGLRQPLA